MLASINPLDKMIRNGEFKQLIKYKRPFIFGHDLAGVITAIFVAYLFFG